MSRVDRLQNREAMVGRISKQSRIAPALSG